MVYKSVSRQSIYGSYSEYLMFYNIEVRYRLVQCVAGILTCFGDGRALAVLHPSGQASNFKRINPVPEN